MLLGASCSVLCSLTMLLGAMHLDHVVGCTWTMLLGALGPCCWVPCSTRSVSMLRRTLLTGAMLDLQRLHVPANTDGQF